MNTSILFELVLNQLNKWVKPGKVDVLILDPW